VPLVLTSRFSLKSSQKKTTQFFVTPKPMLRFFPGESEHQMYTQPRPRLTFDCFLLSNDVHKVMDNN
jgi:peptide methionine sulfoxide reductase MsrA